MNSDDIISMHKACVGVIESITELSAFETKGVPSMIDAQLEGLRQNIRTLAVVQRDLLKSVLES